MYEKPTLEDLIYLTNENIFEEGCHMFTKLEINKIYIISKLSWFGYNNNSFEIFSMANFLSKVAIWFHNKKIIK